MQVGPGMLIRGHGDGHHRWQRRQLVQFTSDQDGGRLGRANHGESGGVRMADLGGDGPGRPGRRRVARGGRFGGRRPGTGAKDSGVGRSRRPEDRSWTLRRLDKSARAVATAGTRQDRV